MYTIKDLKNKFNISRSTILYYDKQGLLSPTKRSSNNYRLYDEKKVDRLSKIVMYREAGISLNKIKELLDIKNTEVSNILKNRLNQVQLQIKQLKIQEKLVLEILTKEVIINENHSFTNRTWTEMLLNLGYKEEDLLTWHRDFESNSPKKHYKFLKSLGMDDNDIKNLLEKIRK
ncbi:MAG: MerR family transcriptional regulator [Firmicutes bacterium]|nr:MerR family transcriptional regulator [Bacillota bacterium]